MSTLGQIARVATLAFLLVCGLSRTSEAASSFKFCARWAYTYNDQSLGEDYLVHESGLTYGVKKAAYSWGEVWRNGSVIWWGYMDSNGCTGVLPGTAGTYEFWATTELQLPGGAFIGVHPDTQQEWRWFGQSYTMSTASSAFTFYENFGIGDSTSNAAAAVTQVALASDHGLVNGPYYYRVYTEQQCSSTAISCYKPTEDAVYLGWNNQFQTWDSFFKNVILHEFGHALQDALFGSQMTDYTSGNSTATLCKCDHVFDPQDRSHCIQSRERGSSAQKEGFGHFIAVIAQNRASDNDAWFPYYKEVRWTDMNVYPPPVGMPAYGWGTWMEQFCPGTNAGTEFDWMNFYYWVHRRTADAFTLTNIKSLYREACGHRHCTSQDDTTWNSLYTAAGTRFGETSGKAQFWRNQGVVFGVDN